MPHGRWVLHLMFESNLCNQLRVGHRVPRRHNFSYIAPGLNLMTPRNRFDQDGTKNKMKIIATFCLALSLLAATIPSCMAETIQAAKAASYVGQAVTVEGVVMEVSTDSRSGNTFINFGGRYPNHLFFGIIFASDADLFSGVHSLEGSLVQISGAVQLYRGKPQIVINDPAQIDPQ
jgi:hypothetical protein